MANVLGSHGLNSLCRDVHHTAREEITTETDGEFIMEYLTTGIRRITIIGKYSVNGSVQFTGFPEVWGSSMPYISNTTISYANRGWVGMGILTTSLVTLTLTDGLDVLVPVLLTL